MKLSIELLSQKDKRWKDLKLGTSTVSTIGGYGCLLCCHSMMLRYYKHELLPDALNVLYKEKGVYNDATLINYWKIPAVFPDIQIPIFTDKPYHDGFIQCPDEPAPLDLVDQWLDKKMPVIGLVDFDAATQGLQSHFVLIIGKDNNDYFILDPMANPTDGAYYFSAKYGDPAHGLMGLRVYSGPVVIEEDNYKIVYKGQTLATYERNPIDKINELDSQLKTAKENFAQEIQNNATLQAALTQQEQAEKELIDKIRATERERDTAVADLKEVRGWCQDLLGIDPVVIADVRALSVRIDDLVKSVKDLGDENKLLKETSTFDIKFRLGKYFLAKNK